MNEFKKRLIMCVTGVFLSGVAAGIFGFTAFGMDPFQVFAHGLWGLTPISFGTFYVILNGILLVFMFFFNRRMIGLGTIINLFLLGYVVEYTDVLLDRIFPSPSVFLRVLLMILALVLRVLLMILALVLASLAASLYFVADMGVSAYDWIALTISGKKGWAFRLVRITTDFICVLIGGLLGATVGAGTVLTAFCMGPVIQFFNEKVSTPLRYGKA